MGGGVGFAGAVVLLVLECRGGMLGWKVFTAAMSGAGVMGPTSGLGDDRPLSGTYVVGFTGWTARAACESNICDAVATVKVSGLSGATYSREQVRRGRSRRMPRKSARGLTYRCLTPKNMTANIEVPTAL